MRQVKNEFTVADMAMAFLSGSGSGLAILAAMMVPGDPQEIVGAVTIFGVLLGVWYVLFYLIIALPLVLVIYSHYEAPPRFLLAGVGGMLFGLCSVVASWANNEVDFGNYLFTTGLAIVTGTITVFVMSRSLYAGREVRPTHRRAP
jgi:hypothetical protein